MNPTPNTIEENPILGRSMIYAEARQLRASQLLDSLLDDFERQQVEAMCEAPDPVTLTRGQTAYQTIRNFREYLDDQTAQILDDSAYQGNAQSAGGTRTRLPRARFGESGNPTG